MNNRILELAKRHQDALIGEGNELIGFEFSCSSTEAFYRAAFNDGIARAMEIADDCPKHNCECGWRIKEQGMK